MSEHHVLSPLDQAHAHRLNGDQDTALRLAIACARAAADAPGPIALIARILIDEERSVSGEVIAQRLVDAFVRRGDLPSAVVSAQLASDAGKDPQPLFAHIAKAFGKGSSRLAAVSPKPPPFPHKASIPPGLEGASLLAEAERVVAQYLGTPDTLAASGPVPELPLFSTLTPDVLERLLSTVRVEEVSEGYEIVSQGDEGHEAFVLARGLLRVVRRQGADETVLAQLGPGSIFGEMALLSAAPRNASVIALEPAQLLVLKREALERTAAVAPALSQALSAFCRARMQSNLVRHARVLSGLQIEQRVELLQKLESRFFEQGDRLIRRDQEADSIYLIASGSVSVSIPEGHERLVLATLSPGDVVGEISMILRRHASADVFAMHPTLAFEINRETLRVLMRAYPILLVELYELATRREDEIRAVVDEEEFFEASEVLV